MIITKMEFLKKYKNFKEIYNIIKDFDFHNKANGNYKINENVYIDIHEKELIANPKYEIHKKHIDIHIPLNKSEDVGFANIEDYIITKKYNEDKDISFGEVTKSNIFTLNVGDIAIFLPEEAHSPLRIGSSTGKIKKALIKIAI